MAEGKTAARRERVREWDVLRAAAFAGVVLQHLLGAMARRSELAAAGKMFCAAAFEPTRFAVPMFVFLFGCSLFYTHPTGTLRYGSYLKKRLVQLALPYVVWTLIYMRFAETAVTPRTLLRNLVLGSGSYHLWYVVMILQFVVLAPVFFALRRVIGGRRALVAAVFVLWLLYLAVTPHWDSAGLAGAVFVRHRTLVFASWMGFFLAGALCGLDRQRFDRWTDRLLPLTGLVYAGSVVWAAYQSVRFAASQGTVNFSCVSFMNPGYAVFTLCGILFLYACARRLARWNGLARLCAFVGRHSYEAYLAHVLVLSWCSLRLIENWPETRLSVFYAILTAATFVGAVLIGWGVDSAARGLRTLAHRRGRVS